MSKIIPFDYPSLLEKRFLQTDLGQLYQSILFDELAAGIPQSVIQGAAGL